MRIDFYGLSFDTPAVTTSAACTVALVTAGGTPSAARMALDEIP